jgi:dTDP-4-dehydrorhamnose 3,5-epimerase
VTDLTLPGLKRVERHRFSDARGFLSRLFCLEELGGFGWTKPIMQITHSCTIQRGTVRGLHFQYPPHAEIKLVSCLRGEAWDVAVDVRAGSKTFLRWHAEHLSTDNGRALLIPEGFAHGFQALTDNVEMLYCHSAAYTPSSEAGLNPKDPKLDIDWPLPLTQLSARDVQHPMLEDHFVGVLL